MRKLTLLTLIGILGAITPPAGPSLAAPPQPPADFAQPQSAPKPEPFPIKMVDQGQFDPALKGYFLPEGFKLEIVLAEPDTINPVGMTFAPDGTLFVMEWRPDPVTGDKWFEVKETFRYKDGTTRQVATMKKFTTDLVKQYSYNPSTGKFGPPKVIISEELPSSILYHDGWLYVTGRGTVRRWRQGVQVGVGGPGTERPANPNDPWSIREIIAQGFCGFHHHQVSGLTLGNDGLLYITSGDDDNYVEGSDGSRATVLRTGAVFRCKPDGSNMEVYSIGYRNPYRDLAYDDKFNWFHVDNDNEDGSRFMGCRIMHVAEGTDFGWRLLIGARCCRPDHLRGAVAGELPGKVPPMLKTGRGSPAGLLIYHDTRIPQQYRGLLYYPDVFRKLVRAYRIAPEGATFTITHEFEFFKSDDPLFRPCQMVTGPDGAIYVCDWRTNSGGAGKLSGDGQHGRIYRITWAGTKDQPALPRRGMDSWAKIQQLPDEQLVAALSKPDLTDRVEARKELVRRGPKSRDLVVRQLLSGGLGGEARLPALGVLMAYWNGDVEDLFRLLATNDQSADVRRVAVDGLALHGQRGDPRVAAAVTKALSDRDPAVRRVAALALGRIGGAGAATTIVERYLADAPGDAFLNDGYIRAIERLGQPGIAALLTAADRGEKERNRVVQAFLALRTPEGAAALPEMLLRPDISTAQREALVRSFTNYQFDPPLPLDPLVEYLARRPNESFEVVAAAVEVLAASGEANAKKATNIVMGLLDHPEDDARYVAIKAVEEIRLTAAAPKLIEILNNPARRESERAATIQALRVLGDKRAIGSLRELLGSNTASSLKSEALRSLAALDATAGRTAAEKLLESSDSNLLKEAIAILTATKPGAKLVADRFIASKLPRDFFPQVNEAINKFAEDPDFVKLRGEVLRGALRVSLEPNRIEEIRKQVSEKGNAKRGRELYLNTKLLACATCHRMEGVGGSVGPDLTRVWETIGIDKLLESMIDPSKEIKEGYQTYRVVTVDAQVFNGLKIKEDDTALLIREATGRDIRIPKDEIETVTASKVSLMPDNSVAQITYDQFIDLLAFLKSRTEQEALRGLVVEVGVTGPYPADMNSATPEVKSGAKWQTLYADPSGTLDLQSLFTGGEGAVYARAYVYSPKPQKITVSTTSANPMRVWMNEVSVFSRSIAPSNPREQFTVDVKQGWNMLLVKVANAGKPATLAMRVSGDGLRTAGTPTELPTMSTGGQ